MRKEKGARNRATGRGESTGKAPVTTRRARKIDLHKTPRFSFAVERGPLEVGFDVEQSAFPFKPPRVRPSPALMLSFLLSLFGLSRDPARAQDAPPPDREPGFKEVLKNPSLLEKLDDFFNQQKRHQRAAKSWSDERVEKAIRHFVFDVPDGDSRSSEAQLLTSLGPRIHPPLLAILRDATLSEKLLAVKGSAIGPKAPINRIASLLADVPSAEAVPLLAKFADSLSYWIRAEIGLAIGAAASANSVEPLRRLLTDEHNHVAVMTVNGISHAIRAKRVDPRVEQELFPELEQLTHRSDSAERAATVLIEFNRDRAIARLSSPELFSPANEGIGGVLEAFLAKNVLAPRGQVLALIEGLPKPGARFSASIRYALHLLGRHRHPDDKKRFEDALKHEDEWISEGGAAGLLAWHDLDHFEEKIWNALKVNDGASLRPAQKRWLAVRSYDGEVNNGGHSQYFLNSTGDTWPDAVAGLEAMGSTERLAILREALAQFGKDGPSTGRWARNNHLAAIVNRDEDAFRSLDDRYYKSKEHIDALLARYVIAHAEDFR